MAKDFKLCNRNLVRNKYLRLYKDYETCNFPIHERPFLLNHATFSDFHHQKLILPLIFFTWTLNGSKREASA